MTLNGTLERIFAGKWIAGESIGDAIRVGKRVNRARMHSIINYLGEEYRDKSDVADSFMMYMNLITQISRAGLKSDISVKATQIGLLIGMKTCKSNYHRIVKYAKRKKIFVWLDMEEARNVGETIELYKMYVKEGNTGICIQSYLKRSINDVKMLARKGAIIRLVKGAHKVPRSGGYESMGARTKNYVDIMDYMFRYCKRFTVGTHDATIIDVALELNKKYKRDVTYAMLNGIRNGYARKLAESGEKVSIYIPFGGRWIAYSYRRLKELSHLKLIIRSLFGG